MRIICLFNLKEGASAEAYEAWARGTDIPGVNALGSVRAFTVHRATGLFGNHVNNRQSLGGIAYTHLFSPNVIGSA